jgi:hypothetical protein
MRQRWKFLIILALMALTALCYFLLRPVNEPKFQGRYLSEWFQEEDLILPDLESAAPEAVQAIRAIGTNALPNYLQWLQYEPSQWRTTLRSKLPRWAIKNQTVSNWLDDPASWRAMYAYRGIEILGTNAIGALPELTAMLNNSNRPWTAQRAMGALGFLGTASIPVLQAALADTNRTDRWHVAAAIGFMGRAGHTNECLPILMMALSDGDAEVRMEATNWVRRSAPQLLPDPAAN